jgi:hypothetical protein
MNKLKAAKKQAALMAENSELTEKQKIKVRSTYRTELFFLTC